MFFAYCANRSLISAEARADLSECSTYCRTPNSASATAPKVFEACCAKEWVRPSVSDPALASAAVRAWTDFQAIGLQMLASVMQSSTAMTVNGDLTTLGTTCLVLVRWTAYEDPSQRRVSDS